MTVEKIKNLCNLMDNTIVGKVTLLEFTSCMRFNVKLSKNLQAKVVNTTSHIINFKIPNGEWSSKPINFLF